MPCSTQEMASVPYAVWVRLKGRACAGSLLRHYRHGANFCRSSIPQGCTRSHACKASTLRVLTSGSDMQAHQLGPQEPPQYALEGSIAIAGAGVSWLRDRLGLIDSVDDCEAVADSVSDTGGARSLRLKPLLPHPYPDIGVTCDQLG